MSIATAKRVVNDLDIERVKMQLETLPDEIKAQKVAVMKAREEAKDAEMEMNGIEADLKVDIAAETDPNTGKNKFSNTEARAGELEKRKGLSMEYAAVRKVYREATFKANEAQYELERLEAQFKAARYMAELVAAELRLYAGNDPMEKEPY